MIIERALQKWKDNDFISKDLFQQLSEGLKGSKNSNRAEETFSMNSSSKRGFLGNTFIGGLMGAMGNEKHLALLLALLYGLFYPSNPPYIIFIFIAIAVLRGPGHLFQGLNGSEEPFLGERLAEFANNRRNLASLVFIIFSIVCCLIFLPTSHVFEILPFIVVAILGSIAYLCQLPQVWLLALLYLLMAWIMNGYGKGAFMNFALPGIIFILLSIVLKFYNKLNIFTKKTFWCGVFCLLLALICPVNVDNNLAHNTVSNFWLSIVISNILILLSI